MHWGWQECRDAFGWTLPQWICFGGYTGAAPLGPPRGAVATLRGRQPRGDGPRALLRRRGRLVENAVGGWLSNSLSPTEWEVGYWRKANAEVDFVVSRGREAVAIEVKSGRPGKPDGLATFCRTYPRARPLIIGGGGLPLEEFFASSPERWLDQR